MPGADGPQDSIFVFVIPKVRSNEVLRDFATIQTIATLTSSIGDKTLRTEVGIAIAAALQKSAQQVPRAVGEAVRELAA